MKFSYMVGGLSHNTVVVKVGSKRGQVFNL